MRPRRKRTFHRSNGVSLLSCVIAGVLVPDAAWACRAIIAGDNTFVLVECVAGEQAAPFLTRYTDQVDGIVIYSGMGNDTVTIAGGSILQNLPFPPEVVGAEDSYLDAGMNIELLGGNDTFTMTGGAVGTDAAAVHVLLGDGDDTADISGGVINGSIFGEAGNDTISVSGDAAINVSLDAAMGTDPGGEAFLTGGEIVAGDGDDTINVSGDASIEAGIYGEGGNDAINISGNASIGGDVDGGDGDDVFSITGGSISGAIFGAAGNDSFAVDGGTLGPIYAGEGADTVVINGGVVNAPADPALFDAVGLEGGNDTFIMTGGQLAGAVSGGGGDDSFDISGGRIDTFLAGNDGNDTIAVYGQAEIGQHVTAEDGNDVISISENASIGTFVDGGPGNDTINVSGNASIGTDIYGGDGDDAIDISGGVIGGSVFGGADNDTVVVSAGQIAGGIEAETVHLYGGTIGGDISGLTGNTLVINETLGAAPLSLADGVSFSGVNASGAISSTDLARFGSQNFTGFASLDASNSTLRFTGPQTIDQFNLVGGSTLFTTGLVQLQSQGGGFGNLYVAGSVIDMGNGSATDQFLVGDLTIDGARFVLDVDQQAGTADQFIVDGTFSALGANVVEVNLLEAPVILGTTEVPIVLAGNTVVPGSFTVEGVSGTAAELFNYQIIEGPAGELILLATPADLQIPAGAQSAVDAHTATAALDTFYSTVWDAANHQLGLATGASPVLASPNVGIYASGQFAHVEHRGFTYSGNGTTGKGPSFSALDFSAVLNIDFNAAKYFEFDDRYGLNIGLFGGYTSSKVELDPFLNFQSIGEGINRAGMFGTYGLFRQGYSYALVAATGFLGWTDISHDLLNTTGGYDTFGFAATASAGHIFMLSDRLRFDLRGGLAGVDFRGGSYTDSAGNAFGTSRVSFGAVKFEPGIYGDFQLGNGMVISPYARLELQQRFGYRNQTSVANTRFDFDDADFSTSLSGGFNLRLSPSSTVSTEVRGKFSSDSTTLAGKLGYKLAF